MDFTKGPFCLFIAEVFCCKTFTDSSVKIGLQWESYVIVFSLDVVL